MGIAIGSDRDMYGCVASAGYSWCVAKAKCYRSWEESCNSTSVCGADSDENGCIATAGYSWCELTAKCYRPWEEKCEATSTEAPTTTESFEKVVRKVVSRISDGARAGIVVAILFAVALIVMVTACCVRRRMHKQMANGNYNELTAELSAVWRALRNAFCEPLYF